MARIRTIKPDFFRHEGLFEAEQASALPLRLAFAGLWTAADREGRFRWQPRQLKLDCLPYDDISFSAVLEALAHHGFIVKYDEGTDHYGYIPSWNKHQHINTREAQSTIPPPSGAGVDACTETHVHARGEGKGKEEEGVLGREGNSSLRSEAREREETRKPDRKPEERLPDGWKPGKDGFLFARQHGFSDPEIVTLAKRFRLNAKQHDRLAADWDAAWCTWVINGAEMKNKPPPRDPNDPPLEIAKIALKTPEWDAWWNYHGGRLNGAGMSFGRSQMVSATDRGAPYMAATRWPPGHEPKSTGASDDRAA